ncbi:hypothetical protein [Paraburkholderia sp. J94]|uniref:hypothetical protein n=1 Tax=Paraburkholderia sp. J94 TaxID=2805441 RepID=UPI002AB0B1A6|nr:hypothetical protein [Paraburkholderia sp. J94]
MPEQLAGDVAWLGGGVLFAWLVCALAQLAALAPAWARRGPARAKPRCKRARREVSQPARHLAFAISFGLLLTIPPGVLAALLAHGAAAVAAAEAGVLAGLWLGARRDLTKRARVAGAAGCVIGASAMAAALASFLLLPAQDALERAALYTGATLGALLFGAAARAWSFGARGRSRARVPARYGDRVLHAAAVVLCAALGYGFAMERVCASAEFGASVLVGACVLCAALGVRLMGGTHRAASLAAPAPPVLYARFAGVPDEWLVAAFDSGVNPSAGFDAWAAGYEAPPEWARAAQHASQHLPRRRRSRHGALRQRQGPH